MTMPVSQLLRYALRMTMFAGSASVCGSRRRVLTREVRERVVRVRLDRVVAGLPVGGADFAVGADELAGPENADGLVDAAAHREVVDRRVLHDAVRVDDEQPAQRDALLGEHAVALAHLAFEVREEWIGDAADAAVDARLARPREVRELAV